MEKYNRYLCIACILFLVFSLLCRYYDNRRDSAKAGDDISISEQINRSEELVDRAGEENRSAQHHVDNAQRRAEEAGAINKRAEIQLTECAELVESIRADNCRAKQLLEDIISTAEERKSCERTH
ncbi:MAG: hypothetical protein UDN34_10260 [Phascolarctobacterium succinatutens]|nr:hypothetical protein [Phascolarctobacterium succinatutens]